MTNKLLLSLALIASVNFANASDPTPTTIDYPVNVAAGGTLNLKTNDNQISQTNIFIEIIPEYLNEFSFYK